MEPLPHPELNEEIKVSFLETEEEVKEPKFLK